MWSCRNLWQFGSKFTLYDALTMLQHRGQDAAGIVTEEDGESGSMQRRVGSRRIPAKSYGALSRRLGVGHVRYPTAGSSGPAMAQPLYVNSLRHLHGAQW